MTKSINYKRFIKFVYQHFESGVTIKDVEDILSLEEDYNKDSSHSLGKSLVLNRLIFSGKKITGEDFFHDQDLYKGINLWIADNHKGKSTIFKVIKLALTGENTIKSDIKPWIEKILLEFQVGEKIYTSYINTSGRHKGGLYNFEIDKFNELNKNQKIETIEKEKVFDFNSGDQFREKIQDFFFEQFSFYSLKYTSKKSGKGDTGLNTNNLSWLTYFKSIYLESKNYEYLFFEKENMGAQGRKIFEMILGLPLTYPINMLTIQRDRVMEEIGKIKLIDLSRKKISKEKINQIKERVLVVRKRLNQIKNSSEIKFNEKTLIEEYTKISKRVSEIRQEQHLLNQNYALDKAKLSSLNEEVLYLEKDENKINKELNKLTKQELNYSLYQETEIFFSNLNIKICPHCETEVSQEKKNREKIDHTCSLCGEHSDVKKVEKEELLLKLNQIKEEKKSHKHKLTQVENNIVVHKENQKILENNIKVTYNKLVKIPSIDSDLKRLKEIEVKIEKKNKERSFYKELLEDKEELIKEEAVLSFQLTEIEKDKTPDNTELLKKLKLKKNILDKALELLAEKRIRLNKDILNKLEGLILNEVHAFGLTSIERVRINDKYDLIFTQNKIEVSFNDLNEGEKLRMKLAFYLSLIQLDIEYKTGRHPRFLIFDSPGSEEMVPEHINGLSYILKDVNSRYKDEFQIFVGTALREFSDVTDSEKTYIKGKKEFIF